MPTQQQIEEYQSKSLPPLSQEDCLKLQQAIQEARELDPEYIEFKKKCEAAFGIQVDKSDLEIEELPQRKYKEKWIAPRARWQFE